VIPKAFADADGTSDIATIGADQLDRRGDEYLGCEAFPDRQTFGFQSASLAGSDSSPEGRLRLNGQGDATIGLPLPRTAARLGDCSECVSDVPSCFAGLRAVLGNRALRRRRRRTAASIPLCAYRRSPSLICVNKVAVELRILRTMAAAAHAMRSAAPVSNRGDRPAIAPVKQDEDIQWR